jgi:hypothetical protein
MSIRGTSLRKFVCVATLVLGLFLFPQLRSLGGNAPRPISSLTGQERMNLPDNTQVRLKSGRIGTLAVLREEHRRRMQRFAKANALAQATRAKMPPINPPAGSTSVATQSKSAAKQIQTATISQVATGRKPEARGSPATAVTTVPHSLVLDANAVISMVPNQFLAQPPFPLPRDYVAACTNNTACLYIPANATLTELPDQNFHCCVIVDEDPLIVDPNLCASDGGRMYPDGSCAFTYPMIILEDFKPGKGTLSTTGRCDSRMQFTLDQMGAIKLTFFPPDEEFTTDNNAFICAIQVWR